MVFATSGDLGLAQAVGVDAAVEAFSRITLLTAEERARRGGAFSSGNHARAG